jgi:hypothetical protein
LTELADPRLDEALTRVMHRFRDFFVEQGVDPEGVPFRRREEFAAPLVTLRGYTYGIRRIEEEAPEGKRLAVEVSANVYSGEFDMEHFRKGLTESYRTENAERPMRNFMTGEDQAVVGNGPLTLESFFELDFDRDLELVEKQKTTASEVTGQLRDTILRMRYWIRPEKIGALTRNRDLFATAVYLYCLRIFVLAYHKTLTADEQQIPFRAGRRAT